MILYICKSLPGSGQKGNFSSLLHPDPNIFSLGNNESSLLNRNCDILGFMKAVVIFPSFFFPQMQASYYFLTKSSQATPASKEPFRQERQWGPAHLPSLAYHCCGTWLDSSYGSQVGKRTLALTSRRPAGPTEVPLTSWQKCWRSNNNVCKGRTAHSPLQYLAPRSQSHAEVALTQVAAGRAVTLYHHRRYCCCYFPWRGQYLRSL